MIICKKIVPGVIRYYMHKETIINNFKEECGKYNWDYRKVPGYSFRLYGDFGVHSIVDYELNKYKFEQDRDGFYIYHGHYTPNRFGIWDRGFIDNVNWIIQGELERVKNYAISNNVSKIERSLQPSLPDMSEIDSNLELRYESMNREIDNQLFGVRPVSMDTFCEFTKYVEEEIMDQMYNAIRIDSLPTMDPFIDKDENGLDVIDGLTLPILNNK